MEEQPPAKQASSNACLDDLGAWWYTVITYMPGDFRNSDRRCLFKCSTKHAGAVLTHPGLVCKALRLCPEQAHLHVSAVSLANSWGKSVHIRVEGMASEQLWDVLYQAAHRGLQQQQPGGRGPVGTGGQLRAITSVYLNLHGLSSLIPGFILERCPCIRRLELCSCTVQSLPAEGSSLASWPQVQALTLRFMDLDASVTAAQVTQQLQCLPGLQSLTVLTHSNVIWAGVPGVLSSQLTSLRLHILDHHVMPEGCVYPQLKHLDVLRVAPEQWVRLHQAAPVLTHLDVEELATDNLAGLPISWVSQLKYMSCRSVYLGGDQPDAAVIEVLKALGKLHRISDEHNGLHCQSSCSSELWAAVMPHLQCSHDGTLFVSSDRPLTRSDVSATGQHLPYYYVQFMKNVEFEPGVFCSLLQLLPQISELVIMPTTFTLTVLGMLVSRADRPVTITIDQEYAEELCEANDGAIDDILAECGHNYVQLDYL